MPEVKREEAVTTTSSSSSSFSQSSHSTSSSTYIKKVFTSGGGPPQEETSTRATSAQASSVIKKVDGQPVVQVHGRHEAEFRQENAARPIMHDKVSFTKMEGSMITEQQTRDSRTQGPAPPLPAVLAAPVSPLISGKHAVIRRKATPARFITPLQGVIVKENDRVFFECVIDGHPEPSISWSHNGGPLDPSCQSSLSLNKVTLVLPRVAQAHAGRYTCSIDNEAGSSQCTCDLVVKKTQFPPVYSKRLQPMVLGIGERLHLEVDVTGTPQPDISWTKDGTPLQPTDVIAINSDGTRQWLVIQQASLTDCGRYGVLASNPAGRAECLADVMVTELIMEQAPPQPHHRILFTDSAQHASKMFTSKSEEFKTEYRSNENGDDQRKPPKDQGEHPDKPADREQPKPQPKPQPRPQPKAQHEQKSPKHSRQEKFTRSTQPGRGSEHSPYCEDTYYSMHDESDDTSDAGRTHKKVVVVSETHSKVMSDKKSEVYHYSSKTPTTQEAKESPQPTKVTTKVPSQVPKHFETTRIESTTVLEQKPLNKMSSDKSKMTRIIPIIETTDLGIQPIPSLDFNFKSTDLVRNAQFDSKDPDIPLEPFPFEVAAQKQKKPKGPPPPMPSKFVKVEFPESDYDSDFDNRVRPKWNPATDSESEQLGYAKVKPTLKSREEKPRDRTPTPPSKFDKPPSFDGPPRPKVEFPDSESEVERPVTPPVVKHEPIITITPTKLRTSVIKPMPMHQPSPKELSPELKPEPVAEEGYIPPPPAPTHFSSNAVGVESTKITTISDTSQFHKRYITQQHTTRVFKLSDVQIVHPQPANEGPKIVSKEELLLRSVPPPIPTGPPPEELPFTPLPRRPRKEKANPPPMPTKFQKQSFRESDYESEDDSRIKPKWQPPDSDAEEPSYSKVQPPRSADRSTSRTRERSPTPPTVFDVPPISGGPLRPCIDLSEIDFHPEERQVSVKHVKRDTVKTITSELRKEVIQPVLVREPSPELPPPEPEPEVGVIAQITEYVVDKVKVESRQAPPIVKEVPTYHKKPYTEIVEKTEKIYKKKNMMEEVNLHKSRSEKITTTVHHHEPSGVSSEPEFEASTIIPREEAPLQEFPFKPSPPRPKRDKGAPPPMPKVFVKGDFTESDYDSDYDSRIKPKWNPTESDQDDLKYNKVEPPAADQPRKPKKKDRTPTPPSKFETPPAQGGPLRPEIKMIEKVIIEPLPIPTEKSPTTLKPVKPVVKVDFHQKTSFSEDKYVLPSPGPQPEFGFISGPGSQDAKDNYIIEENFKVSISMSDDDYYPLTESDMDYTDSEAPKPTLTEYKQEEFPVKRPPPSAMPRKFLKGTLKETPLDETPKPDDFIQPRWCPGDSEGEELSYRPVPRPPFLDRQSPRPTAGEQAPLPPSQFDKAPPQFDGPSRPTMEKYSLQLRERRESLEDYSVPKFPKVEFKPFDAASPGKHLVTNGDVHQPLGSQRIQDKYSPTGQKYVGEQLEDMTQTFRNKAQQFAEKLVEEVFATKEGSAPPEPAGEPPTLRAVEGHVEPQEPQAYRDESRVSEYGTKHIDPDTGLIYFKYDFGYEFGIILPGEGTKIDKQKNGSNDVGDKGVPFPIIHTKSSASQGKGQPKGSAKKPPHKASA